MDAADGAQIPFDASAAGDPQLDAVLQKFREGKARRVVEPEALRAGMTGLARYLVSDSAPLEREETLEIPGPGGPRTARVFHPPRAEGEAGPRPTLLYAHGGGWVMMSPDTHAGLTRKLCVASNAIVVSLDYRLAPEHPYPAGLDDCVAALRWLRDHAPRLGGDPTRIAMAGDSAGGNLTAATALRLHANGEPPPAGALMICPITDIALATESARRLAPDDPILDWPMLELFRSSYLGREQWDDPFVSVARANLEAFPPTCLVAAERDPLHDDALRFAEGLRAAGRPVTLRRYAGMPHAFPLFPGVPAGTRAVADMAEFLRASFNEASVDSSLGAAGRLP